ncbi:hypothetical protein [Sphingomonas sp.]|uniref:hypothetical protein n=1 Tax=Sphingomonas sp. TaxID=28214 RepID=UPI002ED79393
MIAIAILAGALLGILSPLAGRDKDLRSMTESSDETEIGFCSRPSPGSLGFPGHTFVTFSATKTDGYRDFKAVGHTLGSDVSATSAGFSYFSGKSVAGKQMEERYTALKQSCLIVQLNRSDYDKALLAAKPTLASVGIPIDIAASIERYSLGDNDCITFAERVANALKPAGLKVPGRSATDTPAAWISKLSDANP